MSEILSKQQVVFAILEASHAEMGLVQAAVAKLARLAAAKPGCLRYDVYLSIEEPTRLIIHEIWANEEALRNHRGSVHIARFRSSLNGTTAKVRASPFFLLE